MLRFNTLRKKPKVYNIAVLTLVLLVFLAILRGEEETRRLQWGNLALTVYFALVIACLVNAFFRQLRYNPYSYNTILYPGFALFALFLFITHATVTVRCYQNPGEYRSVQMLFTLVHSAKNYMLMTMPLLLVFSIALLISNISLIRHEGPRFVNILGMLLAFMIMAGAALIAVLDVHSALTGKGSLAENLVVNILAAFYLYFECMIIGSIIADVLAASYVPDPDKDWLIVLGCGLKRDGTPTPLLKGRLDLALDFYRRQQRETGKPARFIVSGGQGADEVQSEAASMRDYLLSQGIEDDNIVMEDRSTDTAENMRFSRQKIMDAGGGGEVAFFTTNYHVFRAGLKARRVKLRALGAGAPTKWYFWPNAAVREFVGLLTEHRLKQGLLLFGLAAVYAALTVVVYAQ
ncbi:MAG: YdcF family protein [Oscillospiraceae bacterium]|nr:YdcF family protein [Oscillospiraceae bacterium]